MATAKGNAAAQAALTSMAMDVSPTLSTSVGVGDDSIGPQFRDKNDLTLLFEHAILTIIPTILLIIAAPFHIHYYSRQPLLVRRGSLYWLKLVSCPLLSRHLNPVLTLRRPYPAPSSLSRLPVLFSGANRSYTLALPLLQLSSRS